LQSFIACVLEVTKGLNGHTDMSFFLTLALLGTACARLLFDLPLSMRKEASSVTICDNNFPFLETETTEAVLSLNWSGPDGPPGLSPSRFGSERVDWSHTGLS